MKIIKTILHIQVCYILYLIFILWLCHVGLYTMHPNTVAIIILNLKQASPSRKFTCKASSSVISWLKLMNGSA